MMYRGYDIEIGDDGWHHILWRGEWVESTRTEQDALDIIDEYHNAK